MRTASPAALSRFARASRWWHTGVVATTAFAVTLAAPAAYATSVTPRSAAMSPSAAGQSSAKPEATSALSRAEATASAQAAATGKPVEVTAATTETKQVMANPNGTFTLHSNHRAVRVKQNGTWVPTDATLRQNSDGSWSPKASTEQMAFSNGGTAPMITLTSGSTSLALSWPSVLPKPAIAGATATYPSIYPGVDLQLTAGDDTYSEVLVVHDAQAATNPNLAHIHLTAHSSGLTLAPTSNGGLSATDASGTQVFHGAQPMMWDSTYSPNVGSAPTATNPGSGRVSPLPITTTTTSSSTVDITLTPDQNMLTGPNVSYPVYIDPQMSRGKEVWTVVSSGPTPEHIFNDPNWDAQVGYCDTALDYKCSNIGAVRSYFQMGTQDLQSRNGVVATLFSATFNATQIHNYAGCTATPAQVDEAGPIDANTVWPGPDGRWLDTQSANFSDTCPSSQPWNVPFNVISGVQDAVNGNWPNLTLVLRGVNAESDGYQWKRFANNPTLVVVYSFPPNPAYGLNISNAVNCNGHVYTADGYPTLYASATDNNNPPLNPGLWYELWNGNASSQVNGSGARTIASGTQDGWPEPTFLGNADYQFRVHVDNNPGDPPHDLWAPYSYWFAFTSLANGIAQTPTVSSFDYPRDYWGAPQGAPGTFSFNAGGAANIAGFTYTFTGAGTEAVPKTTDCNYSQIFGTSGGWIPATGNGTATVTIPSGLSVGYHTMFVRSFDFAHNLSPESAQYTFYVAPTVNVSNPRLEAESLATSQPAGQNIPLGSQANCCPVGWSGGSQLFFQGNAAGQSFSMTFNAPATGMYPLGAQLTTAADYGQLKFTLDGTVLGGTDTSPFESYSPTIGLAFKSLGSVQLTAGSHTLTVTVTGTNSASVGNRYMAGIDYLALAAPTNTLEAENTALITPSQPAGQGTFLGPQTGYGSLWSGGAQLWFQGTKQGQSFTLTFTVPVEADYALGANMTKAVDYGQLKFVLDGTTVLENTDTQPFDGYNPTVITTYVPFGGAHLTAKPHTLTVTVTGTTATTGNRYMAGIDYLTLAAFNNVTAADFGAAMNNKGIASDNTTPANLDLIAGNSLSAQALAAAGFAPGSAVTVNGATFNMPAANSATGNDNVIAAGQTIPLVDPGPATAIGLLAASTCGGSPAVAGKVTYTDDSYSNPIFPSVPDWLYGENNTATAVLAHADRGSTPISLQPHLYAIFVPVDPTKKLSKITLPYTGTGFTNSCNTGGAPTAALHILSISPRHVAAGWLSAWAGPTDTAVTPPGGAGFANQTLRMIVHPTVTGSSTVIRLANTNVPTPTTLDAVTVAAQSGSKGAATLAAPTPLTFCNATGKAAGCGVRSITLAAGGEAYSDPTPSPSTSGGSGDLVVSAHLPNAVTFAPVHASPNNATYLANGDVTANTDGTVYTTTLTSEYYLTGVEVVSTPNTTQGTIAILGDQAAAAGAPGGTYQPTWVDDLPAKLGSNLPGSVVNVSLAGTPPADWWKLNDGTGTTATDSTGTHPATTNGGVTWSTDHAGNAVSTGSAVFDGTTGTITTNSSVLNTAQSFTVSTWVKLATTAGGNQTFLIQQGTNVSGFYLEYQPGPNRWTFARFTNDSTANAIRAFSSTAPQTNTWTHLVGVYDATHGAMTLYVNGQASGTASSDTPPWNATGPLVMGRGYGAGVAGNYFTGSLSDVRAYQRALTATDIAQLTGGNPATGPTPGAGAAAAANTGNNLGAFTYPGDVVNRTVLHEPNVRTVIVTLGTNDILAGANAATIEQNLTSLMRADSPYGLKRFSRADGSPIHIILATVPPLGLAASDQREIYRVQLNNDIVKNYSQYGADNVIDFDQAVRDTTNANQMRATYLTNGQPNAAYYNQLAQALANAVATFPPTAQL